MGRPPLLYVNIWRVGNQTHKSTFLRNRALIDYPSAVQYNQMHKLWAVSLNTFSSLDNQTSQMGLSNCRWIWLSPYRYCISNIHPYDCLNTDFTDSIISWTFCSHSIETVSPYLRNLEIQRSKIHYLRCSRGYEKYSCPSVLGVKKKLIYNLNDDFWWTYTGYYIQLIYGIAK